MASPAIMKSSVSQRATASRPCRRMAAVKCSSQQNASVDYTKRAAIAALAAAVVIPSIGPAVSQEEYKTFLGLATPPTSYGGYGGNANEPPKYSFEYPANWKVEQPNKVEKGTQGIDGRVVNPRSKDQRAFVITLTRAGEDNKSFRLTDPEQTFASFAGADYDLQDALSNASNIDRIQKTDDGKAFFVYDIDSPAYHYLSLVTTQNGKIFALFVRSPTKTFSSAEPQLRHIIETFKLL